MSKDGISSSVLCMMIKKISLKEIRRAAYLFTVKRLRIVTLYRWGAPS